MGSQAKAYEVNNNPLLSLVVIAALSSLAYWMVVVDRTPPETRIDGAVVNPGSYQLGPNPTPLEVLRAGGGVVPGARFKFDVLDDVLQQLPSHYVHINSVAESPLSEIETRRIDWIIPEALQNRLAIGSAHHLAYGSANDFGTFYLLQQLEEDDLATLRQHLVKGGFRRMDRTDIDKRERWFKVLVGAYPKPHLLVVRIENDHALEMFFSHQVSWSDKFFLIGSSRKETPEKLLVTLAGQPIRSPVTKEYVDRLIDEMGVDQGVIDIAVGKFLAGMVTNSGVPFYGRTSRCRFRPHECSPIWKYPSLVANWLEIDSDYVISERSEQLIRTAAETFSHLWRPDGTSDPLADQLAEIWEAFEDRAAADTSVMEPLSSRIDTNTLLAAISEMLVCDPECEKVPLDFRDFAGLEKPIVPLKLSAEDTFELLEYDPALGTVTKSSRVAYITLMLKLAVMNSGGDGPTVSGQLRWLELVVEQRYPGPKPSVELMLGELIARNLPVYDGESDEWVRFDTWSKQLVVRVDPSGVDTPFRRDPVGGTVSMIADPSADNIRHLLGLGN